MLLAALACPRPGAQAAEAVLIPPLPLPGILHKPAGGGPFPAVVLLVGFGGYAGGGPNAEHQSSWAARLVEWGYVALQVDSYSPRGGGLSSDFAGSLMVSRDAYAAKSYLASLPFVAPENIAVLGWSTGGMAALRAAVAFYPRIYPVYQPDMPLLVLTGEKDDSCPVWLARELKKKHPRLTLRIYPQALHFLRKHIGIK